MKVQQKQKENDFSRPQGCVPAGAYPSRPSPVPTVPMGKLDLSLPLPSLLSLIVIQLFQALGLIINSEKSILNRTPSIEFLEFTIRTVTMKIHLPEEKMRKIKQEALSLSANQEESDSQGTGQLCWKSVSLSTGNLSCPTILQGTTGNDKLCHSFQPISGRDMEEILNIAPFDCRGPTRPPVVGQPNKPAQHISNPVSTFHSNKRVGCFKIGMGSSVSGLKDQRIMVCSGSSSSHQLFGTSSSFSSPEILYKRKRRPLHSSQDGQYYSPNLLQQDGGPQFSIYYAP